MWVGVASVGWCERGPGTVEVRAWTRAVHDWNPVF